VIPYPFTEAGLTQALRALGKSENEVAANLSALGFRGNPGSECACPVANYLLAAVEEVSDAGVYLDAEDAHADVWTRSTAETARVSATTELPLPVIRFVNLFDRREYPDLIKGEADVAA
jgi:hypothetical protein